MELQVVNVVPPTQIKVHVLNVLPPLHRYPPQVFIVLPPPHIRLEPHVLKVVIPPPQMKLPPQVFNVAPPPQRLQVLKVEPAPVRLPKKLLSIEVYMFEPPGVV